MNHKISKICKDLVLPRHFEEREQNWNLKEKKIRDYALRDV